MMIKKDIIDYLHENHGGLTLEEVEGYTNVLMDLLKESIAARPGLTVKGFGKFRHKQKPVREVILPNGERLHTSGGERIQFLPSPGLKAYLNS